MDNSKQTISRRMAAWCCRFDGGAQGERLDQMVRYRIMDTLAAAAAGSKINKGFNKSLIDLMRSYGAKGESSVLFTDIKLPASMAAYLNAAISHGAELDDGHRTANGHPGVVSIPPVLAFAETGDYGWAAVRDAITVGYEIYVRLSNAVQPELLRRGFHGTGVVGTVSACAAVSKLIGLDEDTMTQALSIAADQASGLFEVSESAQMLKPINPANACRIGIESAFLAKAGAEGPEMAFEGVKGYFHAFVGDEADVSELDFDDDSELKIYSCYTKICPACRHVHPAMDAGCRFHDTVSVRPEEIDSIEIRTYKNAVFATGSIGVPNTLEEAKFSMRYALAVGMLRGKYILEELDVKKCVDEDVRALISKMSIITDAAYEDKAKGIRGAKVTICYIDGRMAEEEVLIPRGDGENPLSEKDVDTKLRDCFDGIQNEAGLEALKTLVYGKGMDIRRLMGLLSV